MSSLVRFACIEALAAILVPSKATRPTLAIPARWHSRSDEENTCFNACSWRLRKREIVVWSKNSPARITLKATSWWQARSICRDERMPTQYAYTSNATIAFGWWAAPPRPSSR